MNINVLQQFSGNVILNCIVKRYISGKILRASRPQVERPKPFPYERKRFWPWNLLESTSHRFYENSKIIIVEGTIASGKTKLAKALAEEFDMLYLPEANMDMLFISAGGFDLRTLNPYLPKTVQHYDIPDFYRNPYNTRSFMLQLHMYFLRYHLYLDALAHVLSTGQGVVLDRSPYSDGAFVESIHRFGYFTDNFKNLYHHIIKASIYELLRPHLIIYLEAPAHVVRKKILERNRPFEVNSEVLSEPFLECFEEHYRKIINDLSDHSELLVYDWSKAGDYEIIVEDIEAIDFDNYERFAKKMSDWYFYEETEWNEVRRKYANDHDILLRNITNVLHLDVPEVFTEALDQLEYEAVLEEMMPVKYAEGYNADLGDKIYFTFGQEYKRHSASRLEHRYDTLKD